MEKQYNFKILKRAVVLVGLTLSVASIVSCSQDEELNLEENSFTDTSESFATPADDKFYTIKNRSNGRTLDISNGSNDNGANLQVWGTDSNTSIKQRQWEILPTSDDYYRLKGVDSRKSIEISEGSDDTEDNAQQWAYQGTTLQQWEFIPTDSGYFRIKNRDSGKSLRVTGSSNGSNVHQAAWDGDENQQWLFTEVGSSNDDDDDDGGSNDGGSSSGESGSADNI